MGTQSKRSAEEIAFHHLHRPRYRLRAREYADAIEHMRTPGEDILCHKEYNNTSQGLMKLYSDGDGIYKWVDCVSTSRPCGSAPQVNCPMPDIGNHYDNWAEVYTSGPSKNSKQEDLFQNWHFEI